jgi:hypothetical protein
MHSVASGEIRLGCRPSLYNSYGQWLATTGLAWLLVEMLLVVTRPSHC